MSNSSLLMSSRSKSMPSLSFFLISIEQGCQKLMYCLLSFFSSKHAKLRDASLFCAFYYLCLNLFSIRMLPFSWGWIILSSYKNLWACRHLLLLKIRLRARLNLNARSCNKERSGLLGSCVPLSSTSLLISPSSSEILWNPPTVFCSSKMLEAS